jgi:cellulose synthase/poly-beta-1,6-N-acetylglucosamine synthase-like glycosyltransferase
VEITYRIFECVNYFFIILCAISFFFQLVMIIFCWLPEKHFAKSEDFHRIAIVIAARNEEAVVSASVRLFLEKQNYPKDKYDVYVVADNCTDRTAEIAAKAGAKVIVHNDSDPDHHRASYAVQYAFAQIMKGGGRYDMFIRFDADNHACDDYLREMNNAYGSGVTIARGFEASTNPTQNAWTAVSAAYYIRDSRIACNFRERCHLDSMLTGAGMMVSSTVIDEIGGWDALMVSDDAEFCVNRLLEKRRIHYVADAIVYEDQPSTMKDNYARLSRMGHGLNHLFWKKGLRLFGHFFTSGRWSDVDLFVQLMIIPVDLICCIWFPLYYVAYALMHLVNGWGGEFLSGIANIEGTSLTASASRAAIMGLLVMIAYVLGTYLVVYPLQTWIAVKLSEKKTGLSCGKDLGKGIWLSAFFMVYYGVAVALGVLTKPAWRAISRNPQK